MGPILKKPYIEAIRWFGVPAVAALKHDLGPMFVFPVEFAEPRPTQRQRPPLRALGGSSHDRWSII